MTFFIPSIAVFETCITDVKYKPVQKLLEPSLECIKENTNLLVKLASDILNDSKNEIYRFPNLVTYLENKINTQIILAYSDKTSSYVSRGLVNMEESYIWTESESFNVSISELMKGKISNIDSNSIKLLLGKYYDTIKENIKNNVPKAIMLHLVNKLKTDILSEIMNKIDMKEIITLLDESKDVKIKRDELISWRNKLAFAKEKLNA